MPIFRFIIEDAWKGDAGCRQPGLSNDGAAKAGADAETLDPEGTCLDHGEGMRAARPASCS
jgi:hypothetical protein